MAESVSQKAIAAYTWDSAGNVSWDDAIVGDRTWATSLRLSYSAQSDEAMQLSDAPANQIVAAKFDALGISEARQSKLGKRISDGISFAEAFLRSAGFFARPNESLGVADGYANTLSKPFFEGLGVSELSARRPRLMQSDSISITDDAKTWAKFQLRFDEAVSLVEQSSRVHTKRLAESIGASDSYADKVTFRRGFDESINIAESYQDIINFLLSLVEGLSIADGAAMKGGKRLKDSFSIQDRVPQFGVGLNPSESLQVAEWFYRKATFYAAIAEAVSIADSNASRVKLAKADGFSIVGGNVKKSATAAIFENVAVLEVVGRTAEFIRAYDEGFGIAEASKRAIKVSQAEALKVADELIKGATGIFDELAMMAAEMSEEDFSTLITQDSPSYYTRFRKMLPGDYEYKDALMRVVLQSGTSDRATLSNLNVTIDVPDVIDRGRVSIDASPVLVSFNRKFIVPPEVSLTIHSGAAGEVLIPRIVGAIGTTGFTLQILKDDGKPASGMVTWTAHGY
ncbi:hypothetical protein [Chromobacterium phragmitis]|uniref:Uncharacterized protein n=1 Tax=Chromobacterium phragmitis TaxID=2202141 RepID=A0ABV0J0J5_9NEIS